MTVVVAIDGPGGAGKSTIAASLAERLGVPHVDTGAFYRAATLAAIEARVDLDDGVACAEVVANAHIERRGDRTILGAQDVEDAIRGPQVTAHVSRVAAHAEVRAALLDLQRAGIDLRGGVVEGRDAGTAVVPDADLKIWLTASPQARAVRRAGQLGETDPGAIAEMGADLSRRDAADAAQMDRAADAVVVDTTGRDVPDLVTELEARVRSLADAGCS